MIITCCESDYLFAKGTCASVKYFMPGVPICFLVDGDFDLGSFPDKYDIHVLKKANIKNDFLRENSWGWGLTKMNAFWESPFETFLVVDADTVLYGDMRKYADFENYDFIIDRPKYSYTPANLNRYYFNPDHVLKYYPGFDYLNNPYVCTGVIFGKRGILPFEEYRRFFKVKIEQPDFYRLGEQGFLNILFFLLKQQGKLRLGSADIQYIVPDFPVEEFKNTFPIPISVETSHMVIHWAGTVKPLLRNRNEGYVEPMIYFRKMYLNDLGFSSDAQIEDIIEKEDSERVRSVRKRKLKGRITKNINRIKNLFR